jgi:hypothetical protein
MKIVHKNSEEEITEFPSYGKYYGIYGFIIVTFDMQVVFFFEDNSECSNVNYEYVTENYNIYP